MELAGVFRGTTSTCGDGHVEANAVLGPEKGDWEETHLPMKIDITVVENVNEMIHAFSFFKLYGLCLRYSSPPLNKSLRFSEDF